MIVAGLGCRKGTSDAQLAAALEAALATGGLALADVGTLATGGSKRDEPAIHSIARRLKLPLVIVGDMELQQAAPHCLTQSDISLRHAGVPSLCEASALAAAGDGAALLGPRIVLDGVTCALARGGSEAGR